MQTASAVQWFFLAMAIYPEVQCRAQEEIDRVIGPNRLPNFNDRTSLPFINAVVKETMRWHMVSPLGMHTSWWCQILNNNTVQLLAIRVAATMNTMAILFQKALSFWGTPGRSINSSQRNLCIFVWLGPFYTIQVYTLPPMNSNQTAGWRTAN